MDVIGVVNAHIIATSPASEKVKATSKIFIVEDIKEVYLSFDFMKDLRIVDTNFPVAGGKLNQHGRNKIGLDRSGTIVETLPNSAYQVSMDSTGRLAKRTRQRLRPFKPWDQAPPQEAHPEVY